MTRNTEPEPGAKWCDTHSGRRTVCGCSSGRELSGKPGICHQNVKAGQETCYPLKSELKKKDFHRGPKPISEMWIQIIKKRAFTVTSAGLISCVISLPQWSWALSLLSETSPGETGFQLPCTKRKKEQARQRGKRTPTVFVGGGENGGVSQGLWRSSGS